MSIPIIGTITSLPPSSLFNFVHNDNVKATLGVKSDDNDVKLHFFHVARLRNVAITKNNVSFYNNVVEATANNIIKLNPDVVVYPQSNSSQFNTDVLTKVQQSIKNITPIRVDKELLGTMAHNYKNIDSNTIYHNLIIQPKTSTAKDVRGISISKALQHLFAEINDGRSVGVLTAKTPISLEMISSAVAKIMNKGTDSKTVKTWVLKRLKPFQFKPDNTTISGRKIVIFDDNINSGSTYTYVTSAVRKRLAAPNIATIQWVVGIVPLK